MIGQRTPSGYREGLNLHCPGVRLPMYVYLYIYVMTVVVFFLVWVFELFERCAARQTPAVPTTGRACDDDDDGVV